jgi:hypothetical protein
MTDISRRHLFRQAIQVAPALILPELILPKRKLFAVGWSQKPIIIELQNERWNDPIWASTYEEYWRYVIARSNRMGVPLPA